MKSERVGKAKPRLKPILEHADQGWLVRAPKGYRLSNSDYEGDEELDFIFLGEIEPREADPE